MNNKRQIDTKELLHKENRRTKVLQLSIRRDSVGRAFLSLLSYFIEPSATHKISETNSSFRVK